MRILMVCLGNICRSPLAQGILNRKIQKAGLDWQVDSAGTADYHVGSAPHKLSQKVARINDIDISNQKCRKFVREDIVRFDKIYVMDENNYQDVKEISNNNWNPLKVDFLLNELYPLENRNVPDPWYGTEPDYHDVFKLIDDACDKICKNNKE